MFLKTLKNVKRSHSLYICSTNQHVFFTLIKCMKSSVPTDIVICDDIPDAYRLMDSLLSSGLFRHVYFFSRERSPGYNPNGILAKIFFRHYIHRKIVEREFKVDLSRYNNIFIYHDGIKLGRYLQDVKQVYHLIEDGVDFLIDIDKTPSVIDLPPTNKFVFFLKYFFNIGYLPCGQGRYCKSIEVNKNTGLKITHKNIIEKPRAAMIDSLNIKEKKHIFDIFVRTEMLSYSHAGRKTALVLTIPLYSDGYVYEMDMQRQIYDDLISELKEKEYLIVIKPHPRDVMDYVTMYPDLSFIDKSVPTEVLNFKSELRFDLAVTILSSSILHIKIAGEKIRHGYSYMRRYPHFITPRVNKMIVQEMEGNV